MSKNYVFREFECGLTKEQTAQLCFKSVRTVTEWDNGKEIPPECKRLMRMYTKRLLSIESEWQDFYMIKGRLRTPVGSYVSAQQLLTALALLEIESPSEIKVKSILLRFVRAIVGIKINDNK